MKRRCRKGRAKSRGVAFEVLLLVPALGLQMGAALWVWKGYEHKLDAMQAVRTPTFTAALSGCRAVPSTSTPISFEVEGGDNPWFGSGVDLSTIDRKLPSAPGGQVLVRPTAGRAARIVRVLDGFAGGSSLKVGGVVFMPCNENAEDGDLAAMKKLATGTFDPRSP